ncbi:MAG TPA: ATP-binding protein [Anaerolineae bacterium]|nr:ATP-binding protein [Anaerolineae bacterium]
MLIIRRYLFPPVFADDEEKTRAASVLNALQLALIVVVILAALASIFVFAEKLGSLLVVGGLGVVMTLARVLMYQGKVRLSSILVLTGIWIVVTLLVTFAGGMNCIDAVYYLSLTVIAGLLLGPRATMSVATITSLAGGAMVLSDMLGYPLPRLFPLPPLAGWINLSFSLFLATITLNIALRSLQEALELSRQRLQEREVAEVALSTSRARLHQLLSVSPAVIYSFTVNGEVQTPVFISENVRRQLGYEPEDIVNDPTFWPTHVYSDDLPRVAEATQRVLQAGYSAVEYRFLRQAGGYCWLRDEMRRVQDTRGPLPEVIGAWYDITERKLAEAEREQLLARIRGQARQVQQIVDATPEGVILLDVEGCVVLANPVGQKELTFLAGVQVGDVLTHLGTTPLPILLAAPPTGLWHELAVDAHVFQVLARPIVGDDATESYVLVIRDVTQQREMEQRVQEQERLAAVGQLAAGIAHDFNNIMAAIMLYVQMSERAEDVPPRIRERLAIIQQQSVHATRLIQQILDFSRRAVFERHPFDVLSALQEHVVMLRRMLPEYIQVTLSYAPVEGDGYLVNGSSAYIRQALLNLALNARDAMPTGGELRFDLWQTRVTVEGAGPLPEMATGDWIAIAVSDTGTGIPAGVFSHIFEPFFTTKEPGKGTGLGLPQVYGIIGMHNGHIKVASPPGQGATFTLYLPAFVSPHLPEPVDKADDELILGSEQTILLVEDNPTTRKALADGLEMLNYRVLSATQGREALTLLSQHPEIALVLSDVLMPEMGGVDLARAMMKLGLHVPVILLTGHPLRAELEGMMANGDLALLADWLLKPPDLVLLSGAIARALKSTKEAPR